MCVGACLLIHVALPFFLSQSHGYNTGQPTQDSRHAVQIVDSTGVLDAQARCQDGLHVNKRSKRGLKQRKIHDTCGVLSLGFDIRLTVRNLKPRVEMIPATNPISIAPNGPMFMSAQVPTATPPAKVAFWMCTCRNVEGNQALMLLLSPKSILPGVTVGVSWYSDHIQFSFVLNKAGHGVGREHACS